MLVGLFPSSDQHAIGKGRFMVHRRLYYMVKVQFAIEYGWIYGVFVLFQFACAVDYSRNNRAFKVILVDASAMETGHPFFAASAFSANVFSSMPLISH